jgi:hypothetical protein
VGGTTVAEATSCYATTYATTDAWTFPVLNTTASTTTAASNWTSIPVTPVATYPVTQSAEPTPTTHQAQMASGCTDFYKVVDGTTCAAILDGFAITLADFYAWNPSVGNDCQFLQLDVYVYILHDSASTATATTKTTSATTISSSAPAPPQHRLARRKLAFRLIATSRSCSRTACIVMTWPVTPALTWRACTS